MATTIPNGSKYMQAVTYTGTGATQTITVGFQPDFVWVKSRSAATDHKLTDSVRGVTKALISDTTGAETTDTNGVTAFTSTGFTLGSDSVYNTNAATYVAWCWTAGAGSSSSNTNGSITSTVSVNATAGFSVVTYTGTGVAATIGHGLGVAPKMIIVKSRNNATSWAVYHTSLGGTKYLLLDSGNLAVTSSTEWNNLDPTSTIINVGGSGITSFSGYTYVAYCFANISGYSSFGSYVGNNSTDGPFVYCGFRPKFILIKKYAGGGAADWHLHDTTRDTYNSSNTILLPDSAGAEAVNAAFAIDILSNGFKLRTADASTNGPSYNMMYAAFAENPFKNALAR